MHAIGDIVGLLEWGFLIASGVGSCVVAIRMRHRIKKALGVKPRSEIELTSVQTWLEVEKAEEEQRGGRIS